MGAVTMGEASMRKWMKRARAELPHDQYSRPRESYVYRTAIHMRLRERKRREFMRSPAVRLLPLEDR